MSVSLYGQVGIGTTTPEGILDIKSVNRGLLIPRVDLTSLTVQSPVTNPQTGNLAESTLIYHKGTNGIDGGFYYWDVIKWSVVGEKDNNGLQYFVYNTSSSPPNNDRNALGTVVGSGIWTGNLNTAAQASIKTGDNFIIYFSGNLEVKTAGNFQLQSVSDDGARVYIDNSLVLTSWVNQGSTTFNGDVVLLSKGNHKIEFWYYEALGSEIMIFNWLQNANGIASGTNVLGNNFTIK